MRIKRDGEQRFNVPHDIRDGQRRTTLVSPDESGFERPVLLWVASHGNRTEVEVYGQPDLYAEGDSLDEAKQRVVQLVKLYLRDLDPEAPATGHLRRLESYLGKLALPAS